MFLLHTGSEKSNIQEPGKTLSVHLYVDAYYIWHLYLVYFVNSTLDIMSLPKNHHSILLYMV